ncbi:hypothetical protein TWF281_000467 [Arthrobotrys megalospora]
MHSSLLLFLPVYMIIALGNVSSKEPPEQKVRAYSWVGEIKAPKHSDSPPDDICLSIDPTLTEATVRDKRLVPRICNDVSPKWTTWRATGLVTENPGKPHSTVFKGFIEHVTLGWCITYNAFGTGWDEDQSFRGWLTLKNCDDLKELAKDRDVEVMKGLEDEEYDHFINVIKFSTNHTYLGKILKEGDYEDSKLARRIFLSGTEPSLYLGETTDLVAMDGNQICGGYGGYAKALNAARREGDEKFSLPNWSIMASYHPQDTCKKKIDPYTGEEIDRCSGEWRWGCGFGTVYMDPVFELGK